MSDQVKEAEQRVIQWCRDHTAGYRKPNMELLRLIQDLDTVEAIAAGGVLAVPAPDSQFAQDFGGRPQ